MTVVAIPIYDINGREWTHYFIGTEDSIPPPPGLDHGRRYWRFYTLGM